MRALTVILATSIAMFAAPAAQERGPYQLRQAWEESVRAHAEGKWDEPAKRIGDWTSADLRAVYDALRPQLRDAPQSSDTVKLLIAGAMFHTDIGMLGSGRAIRSAPGDEFVALSLDGRDYGQQPIDPSWQFARSLLEPLTRGPSTAPLVRLWYGATTAYMARYSMLGDALRQLEQARRLFPKDAEVQFDSGWLYEALSGPRTQAAREELVAPRGMRAQFNSPSAAECLERAQEFYARALVLAPGHVEARVRRGRVRSQRGDEKGAIADLRLGIEGATDPYVKYYALLFLGAAYEKLDDVAQARAAYERAATLYLLAQSPHLALARLATRRGDMPAAQREIQQVLRLSPTAATRGDPWWVYYAGRGRNADALLENLREALAARGGP